MILPEGKNKKYIRVIIGIYVVFTIVYPIVSKFSKNEINIEQILENTIQTSSNYKSSSKNVSQEQYIANTYINKLKTDVKNKIKEKGYLANNITIEVKDYVEYKIKNISFTATKIEAESKEENKVNSINNIQINEIKIGNTVRVEDKTKNKGLTNTEKESLREYLKQTYEAENININ